MAKAKKLPSGNWRVQASVTINGKTFRKSFTDPERRRAEAAAAQWQAEKAPISYTGSMTLERAVDKYIDLKRSFVSPSTTATYEKYKRNYFQDLMQTPLEKIDKFNFNSAVSKMSVTNAPKTVRSAASFFNTVIAYYTEKRIVANLPRKERLIYKTPDQTTLRAIFKASEGTDIEVAVLLAAWLGLRQSEIRGLKWSKVKKDVLIIDTALVTVNGKSIEKRTKTTNSTRVVPLPKYIREKMEQLPKSSEYVVPLSASTIGKHFKKMLQKNNIPDCRFHDLRHATASIMLLLGIPEKYAMDYCGWETPDTMREVYQQIYDDERKNVFAKMDNYFMSNIV